MTNATSSMAGTSATRSGYGPLMKFSLLSISLLLTSSNAISGVMPALIKQFPDQPRANVELLSTVPSFSMIIMIIASGFIARKIGDKATVTAGLVIAAIFGIIPFLFTGNFWVIMGSRIGLGVGFGLINSLAVSMIAKFFSGDEKATLMGFRSAFESLGQSLMTLAAGFLVLLSWNSSFLVYLLAVPILILFVAFVPKEPDAPADAAMDSADSDAAKQSVNGPILLITVFLIAAVTMYVGLTTRLSSVIADSGFGTIQQASTLLSVMTIGGMLMGFAFGFINKALQAQTLTVGLAALAAGSLVIYFAPNFVVLCAGAMIAGISYPTMISYTFNQISEVCPKGSDTLCTSVVLVGCNLGAFTAPYTLKLVGGSALSQPYLVYGIVLLVIAAAYAAYHLIRK
ncbi:MAG: MFS transporter [Bifidobacterium dentium]